MCNLFCGIWFIETSGKYRESNRKKYFLCNTGGGEIADELRKEIQSLRIRVEQLESELESKNSEIKQLANSSHKISELQVSY